MKSILNMYEVEMLLPMNTLDRRKESAYTPALSCLLQKHLNIAYMEMPMSAVVRYGVHDMTRKSGAMPKSMTGTASNICENIW